MGRCEMLWTTTGTNRVCSRCLALKGTVVGHTDEVGVLLPPLHPRCRCAIAYRETRGLAAGNTIRFDESGKSPYKIGAIDFKDAAQVKQVLDWAEARIVTAPVENAIIITQAGEVYHCTGGLNSLDSIVELGRELEGAIVTHNHPVESVNEYSFSNDDWLLFRNYGLKILRGVDERFVYEFNRNPNDLDTDTFSREELFGDTEGLLWRHIKVIELAKENNIGYRRWTK